MLSATLERNSFWPGDNGITFNQMKRTRRFRHYLSYVSLGVLSLFFGLIAVFGDRGLIELYRVRRATHLVQQELQVLREGNQHLLQEIQGLRDDPFYIEKIAREELGLAHPGEILILLPREDDEKTRPQQAK